MKNYILFFLLLGQLSTWAQKPKPAYDKELAQKLGANDYGMKSYIFVLLKTGPRDSVVKEKNVRDSLFKGHMANIGKMAEAGKLVVAGPFGKNDKAFRGLFILDVKTKEEALVLMSQDPTIREKIFEVDMVEWYGSAALPVYLDTHRRISRE